MAFIINILKRIWEFFFGSDSETSIDKVSEGIPEQIPQSKFNNKSDRRKSRKRTSNYRWTRFFNIEDRKSASETQLALRRARFGNFTPIQPFRVNHHSAARKS